MSHQDSKEGACKPELTSVKKEPVSWSLHHPPARPCRRDTTTPEEQGITDRDERAEG